jgi:vancomycin resistance protein YoaR
MRIARGPIRDELRRLFGDAETEPVNARFAVDAAGAITIVPSAPGAIVDPDVVRHALETEPSRRVVPVRIAKVQPSFTTALATRLHVTDEVGSFTTPYDPGLPRVTNIQRAAELLDGTILEAGETFSLNQRLGERTLDRGFVLAPQIETGELKDAVGGGVSQVATTLFNAAFMSGLRLDAHTAHEFYISRYPPGREATVSWGGPEMVFTNDWPAPLVIVVEAGTDHITVRFFSRRLGRRVEYGTDAPTDSKPPKERRVLNPALAPGTRTVLQDAGSAGFTIGYWRKVYRDGRLSRDERFTTHYRPEDRIVEVGPKPKPKPKPSTASGTTGTATGPGSTGPDAGATTISG